MPKNWKTYKLGEIAEVQNGFAIKSSDFSYQGMPVIKIKNIVSPRVSFDDVQYYEGDIDVKLKQFIINKDDILISMTGSHLNQIASAVGKVCKYQFEFPALLNQRVGKLFSKDISTCMKQPFHYDCCAENSFGQLPRRIHSRSLKPATFHTLVVVGKAVGQKKHDE